MDVHAGLKTQQLPDLGLGKAFGPVSLDSKRFQRRS